MNKFDKEFKSFIDESLIFNRNNTNNNLLELAFQPIFFSWKPNNFFKFFIENDEYINNNIKYYSEKFHENKFINKPENIEEYNTNTGLEDYNNINNKNNNKLNKIIIKSKNIIKNNFLDNFLIKDNKLEKNFNNTFYFTNIIISDIIDLLILKSINRVKSFKIINKKVAIKKLKFWNTKNKENILEYKIIKINSKSKSVSNETIKYNTSNKGIHFQFNNENYKNNSIFNYSNPNSNTYIKFIFGKTENNNNLKKLTLKKKLNIKFKSNTKNLNNKIFFNKSKNILPINKNPLKQNILKKSTITNPYKKNIDRRTKSSIPLRQFKPNKANINTKKIKSKNISIKYLLNNSNSIIKRSKCPYLLENSNIIKKNNLNYKLVMINYSQYKYIKNPKSKIKIKKKKKFGKKIKLSNLSYIDLFKMQPVYIFSIYNNINLFYIINYL